MSRERVRSSPRLGVGLYSFANTARILRVHVNTLRRWARDPVLCPRYFNPEEQTLSFKELMELHFIKMFRDAGVSLQAISKAARAAAAKFGTDYPFAVKRFDTDGRTVFATLIRGENDTILVEDLQKGQLVFDQIVRPFFKKLEYDGSKEIARYWPMMRKGRVVLDPARKFGQPIDFHTGVPTRALYEATVAGDGQDYKTVARWFDVPAQAVSAAVKYEKMLAM